MLFERGGLLVYVALYSDIRDSTGSAGERNMSLEELGHGSLLC